MHTKNGEKKRRLWHFSPKTFKNFFKESIIKSAYKIWKNTTLNLSQSATIALDTQGEKNWPHSTQCGTKTDENMTNVNTFSLTKTRLKKHTNFQYFPHNEQNPYRNMFQWKRNDSVGISSQLTGVDVTLKNDLHSSVTSKPTWTLLAPLRPKVFRVSTGISSERPNTSASSARALQVRGDTEMRNMHYHWQSKICCGQSFTQYLCSTHCEPQGSHQRGKKIIKP